MLSEQQCELISAFLDGELGRRERKLALRLLRHSGEARALLQRLQEDSHSLQLLPRHHLSADFPQAVLRTLRERGLRPHRPAKLPLRARTIPSWLGVAAAASVLLLIGTGSFLMCDTLFPPKKPHGTPGEFAEHNPPVDRDTPKETPLNPLFPNIIEGALVQFAKPVEVQVALKELRHPKEVGRLTEELKQDSSFQVNVSVRNRGKALQRLQATMNKQGIQVFVDQSVLNQVKKPQPKHEVAFVVYTENMQPEEVAGLLAQLGQEDKGTPNNPDPGQAVVSPLSTNQRTKMSKMLGVPVQDLAPPEKQGRIELFKAVMMDPAPQKKTDGEKKGQGGPQEKLQPARDRFAVVLAVTPGANANPMASRAVRDFLARRQPQRPGTLQVMMVVHQLT